MGRLLQSRKLWGALIGSIFIVVILKMGDVTTIPVALTVLGGLWGAAIAGQAGADYIKAKQEEKLAQAEVERSRNGADA